MTQRSRPLWGLLALALLLLAGCGRLNRTATLNEITPGATVDTTLEQQLAKHGFPTTHVSCRKTMIVNVGTTTICSVSGAGTKTTVRFTFSSPSGAIRLSSVKAS